MAGATHNTATSESVTFTARDTEDDDDNKFMLKITSLQNGDVLYQS